MLDRLLNRSLFSESAAALLLRLVGTASGFFFSLVVARFLSPEDAGLFFLALSVVTLLATVGLFGLNQSVLRFVGMFFVEKRWQTINSVVKLAALRAAGGLVILSLALFSAAPWVATSLFGKGELAAVLRCLAPAVVFIGLTSLVAHQLQAIRRTLHSILVLSIALPLGVGLSVLIIQPASVLTFAVLYSLAGLFTLCMAVILWRMQRPSVKIGHFDPHKLWASCIPIGIMILVEESARWSGQLIAGALVSADDFAHLAVAQRVANLMRIILIAVNLVLAPRIASLYSQNKLDELRRMSLSATRMMVLCALPVLVLLAAFSGWIMGWFGEGYRQGAVLLVILMAGQFVAVMSGSVTYLLTMSGHERDMRNVVLLSCPMAIGSALILTLYYGVVGAALATSLAVVIQSLLAAFMVKRRLGFNTLAIWQRR